MSAAAGGRIGYTLYKQGTNSIKPPGAGREERQNTSIMHTPLSSAVGRIIQLAHGNALPGVELLNS